MTYAIYDHRTHTALCVTLTPIQTVPVTWIALERCVYQLSCHLTPVLTAWSIAVLAEYWFSAFVV